MCSRWNLALRVNCGVEAPHGAGRLQYRMVVTWLAVSSCEGASLDRFVSEQHCRWSQVCGQRNWGSLDAGDVVEVATMEREGQAERRIGGLRQIRSTPQAQTIGASGPQGGTSRSNLVLAPRLETFSKWTANIYSQSCLDHHLPHQR